MAINLFDKITAAGVTILPALSPADFATNAKVLTELFNAEKLKLDSKKETTTDKTGITAQRDQFKTTWNLTPLSDDENDMFSSFRDEIIDMTFGEDAPEKLASVHKMLTSLTTEVLQWLNHEATQAVYAKNGKPTEAVETTEFSKADLKDLHTMASSQILVAKSMGATDLPKLESKPMGANGKADNTVAGRPTKNSIVRFVIDGSEPQGIAEACKTLTHGKFVGTTDSLMSALKDEGYTVFSIIPEDDAVKINGHSVFTVCG